MPISQLHNSVFGSKSTISFTTAQFVYNNCKLRKPLAQNTKLGLQDYIRYKYSVNSWSWL